jgi:uncharacterized membrane protein
VRLAAWIPAILIVAGVAAIAAAVVTGHAEAGIFVVFPVIFGSSAWFLVGVILLVAGMFSLPLALAAPDLGSRDRGDVASGGLVLIGPIPIFWGAAGRAPRRVRLAAAVAGGALVVIATVLVFVWVR